MSYEVDKGAHSVYSLYYHFIQVVKYRRKVFVNGAIVNFLKTKTREIAETFDVDILDSFVKQMYETQTKGFEDKITPEFKPVEIGL